MTARRREPGKSRGFLKMRSKQDKVINADSTFEAEAARLGRLVSEVGVVWRVIRVVKVSKVTPLRLVSLRYGLVWSDLV